MALCCPENTISYLQKQNQLVRYNSKNFNGLHSACKKGDFRRAMRLINGQDDRYTTLSKKVAGCTPLHVAVTYGRTNLIRYLILKGADFTLTDDTDETPLHIAYKKHDADCIDIILQAYYTACSRLSDDLREAMVRNEYKIDNNIQFHRRFFENFRPLHYAVTFHLVNLIPILLDRGIDIDARDSNGMTALHCAVQQSQMGLLHDDYLHNNLSKNPCKHTSDVFLSNLVQIVDLLLLRGSDINARDDLGRTPIFCLFDRLSEMREGMRAKISIDTNFGRSVTTVRPKIMLTLLWLHPDLCAKDNEGNTVIHMMAKAGGDFYTTFELSIAERYILTNGKVNELNNSGHTALYYACERGYKKMIEVLFYYGAEVNLTRSEDRERPIHAMVRYLAQEPVLPIGRQIALIQLLLRHGAYVDAEMADGTTPILLATCPKTYANNTPLIMCLLNWGCDVNCANAEGRTPLHNVCQLKNLQLIEELIWHGADVNALDAQGNTPFSIAFRRRSFDLPNSLDAYAILKKLTILGAPLCEANKELYFYLRAMSGDMMAVGKNILQRGKFKLETIINRREYEQKLEHVPTEEQCRAELELMKTVHIDDHTTLYDILRKNTNGLNYRRSENMDLLADAHLDEDYPVYGNFFKAKLRVTSKSILIDCARERLKNMFQADMPDAFNRILANMKHEDMLHFTQAFKSSKVVYETETKNETYKRLRVE